MENTNVNEEIEIDIKQLFYAMLSKAVYIIGAGVIVALIAFIYFNFMNTKVYTSTTKLYVISQQNDVITSADISVSTYLSNDYMALITTRPVLEEVIAELALDMTPDQLKGKITAAIVTNSRIISITVTDTSPIRAKRIADCLAKVSSIKICNVMNIELVNIVQDGEVPSAPVATSVVKYTILGFMLGAFAAAALVVAMFIMKDTIVTPDDVERHLKISVIGTIPLYEVGEKNIVAGKRKKKKTIRKA